MNEARNFLASRCLGALGPLLIMGLLSSQLGSAGCTVAKPVYACTPDATDAGSQCGKSEHCGEAGYCVPDLLADGGGNLGGGGGTQDGGGPNGCVLPPSSTPDAGGGTCFDGNQNGFETGKDCGGADCNACRPALSCPIGIQCKTGISCLAGRCIDASDSSSIIIDPTGPAPHGELSRLAAPSIAAFVNPNNGDRDLFVAYADTVGSSTHVRITGIRNRNPISARLSLPGTQFVLADRGGPDLIINPKTGAAVVVYPEVEALGAASVRVDKIEFDSADGSSLKITSLCQVFELGVSPQITVSHDGSRYTIVMGRPGSTAGFLDLVGFECSDCDQKTVISSTGISTGQIPTHPIGSSTGAAVFKTVSEQWEGQDTTMIAYMGGPDPSPMLVVQQLSPATQIMPSDLFGIASWPSPLIALASSRQFGELFLGFTVGNIGSPDLTFSRVRPRAASGTQIWGQYMPPSTSTCSLAIASGPFGEPHVLWGLGSGIVTYGVGDEDGSWDEAKLSGPELSSTNCSVDLAVDSGGNIAAVWTGLAGELGVKLLDADP